MSEQDLVTSERSAATGPGPESGTHKSRRLVWIVIILLVVGGIVAYRMYSPSQPANAAQHQGGPGGGGPGGGGPVSVGTVPMQKKDVPFYLTGLGTVTALNTVTVHTRVDGQIMSVAFKEGQFV